MHLITQILGKVAKFIIINPEPTKMLLCYRSNMLTHTALLVHVLPSNLFDFLMRTHKLSSSEWPHLTIQTDIYVSSYHCLFHCIFPRPPSSSDWHETSPHLVAPTLTARSPSQSGATGARVRLLFARGERLGVCIWSIFNQTVELYVCCPTQVSLCCKIKKTKVLQKKAVAKKKRRQFIFNFIINTSKLHTTNFETFFQSVLPGRSKQKERSNWAELNENEIGTPSVRN